MYYSFIRDTPAISICILKYCGLYKYNMKIIINVKQLEATHISLGSAVIFLTDAKYLTVTFICICWYVFKIEHVWYELLMTYSKYTVRMQKSTYIKSR